MADSLRFRLVCKLWMKGSGTKKPHELSERIIDDRFHPRRWILVMEPAPEATPTRHKLLNVTTRKIIKVDLPELDGHAVLLGPNAASEGMLVVCERTLIVCLLGGQAIFTGPPGAVFLPSTKCYHSADIYTSDLEGTRCRS